MRKKEIIEKIAKERLIEEIIGNLKASRDEDSDDLQDLAQDTYIELLTKPNEVIESLYENNQLKFYLTRMIINAISSKTSRYYYIYKKNKLNQRELKFNDTYTEQG